MSDAALHLTDEQLAPFLTDHNQDLVMVDFFASWCGPCQMSSPILEQLARDYKAKKVHVVKVDVDLSPQSVAQYGITSMPTIVMIRNNQELERVSGFLGKAGFEQLITKHLVSAV